MEWLQTHLIEDFEKFIPGKCATQCIVWLYHILQGGGFSLTDYGLPMPDILMKILFTIPNLPIVWNVS